MTETPKVKTWKRIVVGMVGLVAVVVSIALWCVRSEGACGALCKWAVLPLLFGGGIWFIAMGVRGRPADVDDTVRRILF